MPSSKQPYQAVPNDGEKVPLRQYVDEASSDEDDLDSLTDGQDRKPSKTGAQANRQNGRPWQRLCCGLQFSNACLIITFLFIAATVILLGGGGLLIYKTAPKDGQSPPWYPTPRGGTVESWQKSYYEAAKMVERMSIVEKVNITTGTG
jgi:hypothetical protein